MTDRLIDQETRQALAAKFEQELRDEVHLRVFVGEKSDFSDFVLQLVQELNEVEGRIQYTLHETEDAADYGVTSTPTILVGWDEGYRIRYTGAPAGHEAGGFIETISLVSRGESGLQPKTLEKLENVDQETRIQVFVTPSCPHCPRASLLANQIAIAVPGKVSADTVEATQNGELARQYNVSSVPQQVINEDMESVSIGAQPEGVFVEGVLAYGASRYEEIMAAELERRAQAEKLVDEPSSPLTLTDRNFDEAVAKYANLVVDCWAEWCMPCRMVAPIIEEFAGNYQGKVVFGKLDVDHNQQVAQRYGIMSIPTLMFFKDGELQGTQVGALPKENLEGELRNHQLID
jgi:thioredoxin 1